LTGDEPGLETGTDRAERESRLLGEIARRYPDKEVKRVYGVGWEAYPKGTVIFRAVDLGAIYRKLQRQDEQAHHEPDPATDSVYSMEGPNAGRHPDLRNRLHYPAEGICVCGEVVRAEAVNPGGPPLWVHTGRMPGEP
jgi:hypothetical protein